jgi:sugar lactone lactonase YvrE
VAGQHCNGIGRAVKEGITLPSSGGFEMTEVSILADYGDLCGECPIWDSDAGCLFWTDIAGSRFYRYHQLSNTHEIVREGLQISGFSLNQPGGFVVTNSKGIWLWDGDAGVSLIADQVSGSICQMNDCIADPAGRLYAGTSFYKADAEYERGKLIRVETNGAASIVDDGFHMPNGLGFSPDSKTLYFTDSVMRCIYAYDYESTNGDLSRRRIVVTVPDTEGLPDGMTVDSAGFIWSAQWYGSCVVRYDPDGKVERRIPIPAKQTSAIAFGGEDLTDIFVTSAGKSEPMPIMPPGYRADSGYFGGRLYHLNLDFQGKAEFKSSIALPG